MEDNNRAGDDCRKTWNEEKYTTEARRGMKSWRTTLEKEMTEARRGMKSWRAVEQEITEARPGMKSAGLLKSEMPGKALPEPHAPVGSMTLDQNNDVAATLRNQESRKNKKAETRKQEQQGSRNNKKAEKRKQKQQESSNNIILVSGAATVHWSASLQHTPCLSVGWLLNVPATC